MSSSVAFIGTGLNNPVLLESSFFVREKLKFTARQFDSKKLL
jgi:hypothetical protein